jgi:hypothetical protein
VPADKVGPTGTANFTVMTDTGHGLMVGFFGEANVNRPAAAQRIGMRAMGAAQGPRPPNWTGVCEPTAGPSKTVDDLVGQTFSSKKDGTQTFTYSYGASSSVGVGYNASLKGGTWSQNDTHTFGSTATASYGTKSGRAAMYYEAEFQGDIVKWNCYVPGGSSGGYRTTAITGYDGAGYRVQVKKAPWNARDCVRQGGGMTIKIEKSKAIQWSNGLNFSNLGVDVDLSSQTGYSTDAETQNHWDSRGLFCGVNAPPNNNGAYINVER